MPLDGSRLLDCDLHDGTWLTADDDWLPGPGPDAHHGTG
jgi:hypothetical protein